MVDQNRIEENLLECRRLLTSSVTDLPKFSTPQSIQENPLGFIRECHKSYKEAEEILIQLILEIEDETSCVNTRKGEPSTKSRVAHLNYWKALSEIFFNSFVWITMGWDRSAVRRVFKGPKFGTLTNQNIDSVLAYVRANNTDPDQFVIPLDFCRFTCISDVLKVILDVGNRSMRRDFIEVKSGKVNEDMLTTVQQRADDSYFRFFDRYGSKGIEQMQRFFRQQQIAYKSLELMQVESGVFENPVDRKEKVIIVTDDSASETYAHEIVQLFEAANRNEFAVSEIDHCLVVGVINDTKQALSALGEYDIRLFIYHTYVDPETLDGKPYPDDLNQVLMGIPLTDWREGFSSVVLQPLATCIVPDPYLMDLLFGRKRLMYFFNPQHFVHLCQKNGINAGLVTVRQSKLLKSQRTRRGLVAFDGKFIRISHENGEEIVGDGTLHEIFYNWIRPESIIHQFKQTETIFRKRV
jgi:hypothetical protein